MPVSLCEQSKVVDAVYVVNTNEQAAKIESPMIAG
jgi:outer membrane PBP1 activator LpoA protein